MALAGERELVKELSGQIPSCYTFFPLYCPILLLLLVYSFSLVSY